MLLFGGFLLLLGYGFDRFYLGGGEFVLPFGTLLALGVGGFSAASSYFSGDRAVLLSTGAVPIDRALSAAPEGQALRIRQLDNVVEEMAIASGLPKPRVFVVPDPDPNAFATGRDPEHASIAVTQGLLDAVNREELQAVVAHELSHIRNLDIRLMTVIAALVGAVTLLADWTGRGMRSGVGSSGRSSGNRKGKQGGGGAAILLVVWVLAMLVAPIVGRILAMMVSRNREFLADATGAELTRNPLALAGALEKIDAAAAPTLSAKRGTAHLCIADPMGAPLGLREGRLADLFASHPPMAKRIAALRAMAFQA
jgi:heat shock protein HtpX